HHQPALACHGGRFRAGRGGCGPDGWEHAAMNPVNSAQPYGRPTCGAKTRAGTPCKRAPVPGRTRCRLHGGLTPAGASHYNFKTGRYSKVLPARLRERYEEAAADPELLALREDIALLDSRLDDLLKRVD